MQSDIVAMQKKSIGGLFFHYKCWQTVICLVYIQSLSLSVDIINGNISKQKLLQ
jgi:hypothetical protein